VSKSKARKAVSKSVASGDQPGVSVEELTCEETGSSGAENSVPQTEPPETAEAAADSPQDELERLKAEIEQANDRVLRTQAELENYRKRTHREMEEQRRYAMMPIMRDLLPVVDNIDRAIAAAEKAGESPTLLEGFNMVADQLSATLERYHCKKTESLGTPFDPHLHEAISQQPDAEHPPGTVLHEAVIGYTLHDRVVRPSQVIVSAAPLEEDEVSHEEEPS